MSVLYVEMGTKLLARRLIALRITRVMATLEIDEHSGDLWPEVDPQLLVKSNGPVAGFEIVKTAVGAAYSLPASSRIAGSTAVPFR